MGLVTARAFAEAGAAVALADVHENAVRSAAVELVAAGHKAISIRCNVADEAEVAAMITQTDRKSTRLNSSHSQISYAVFCLKKKIKYLDLSAPHLITYTVPATTI